MVAALEPPGLSRSFSLALSGMLSEHGYEGGLILLLTCENGIESQGTAGDYTLVLILRIWYDVSVCGYGELHSVHHL